MEGGLYKPIDYLLLGTWRGCGVGVNPAGARVWGGEFGSLEIRQYNNRYKLVRSATNYPNIRHTKITPDLARVLKDLWNGINGSTDLYH